MSEITRILNSIERGELQAADELLPLVYDELRKLAAAKLAHEQPGQTLQPTALVHDAYLRLVRRDSPPQWQGHRHFFAAAAEAMRRILIENARHKQRLKHGGGFLRVELDDLDLETASPDENLLALDEALTRLEAEAPDKAQLVKLRYFAGMTIPEAAQALGISHATAERYWNFARVWLFSELSDSADNSRLL